jgi:hypothetical protein
VPAATAQPAKPISNQTYNKPTANHHNLNNLLSPNAHQNNTLLANNSFSSPNAEHPIASSTVILHHHNNKNNNNESHNSNDSSSNVRIYENFEYIPRVLNHNHQNNQRSSASNDQLPPQPALSSTKKCAKNLAYQVNDQLKIVEADENQQQVDEEPASSNNQPSVESTVVMPNQNESDNNNNNNKNQNQMLALLDQVATLEDVQALKGILLNLQAVLMNEPATVEHDLIETVPTGVEAVPANDSFLASEADSLDNEAVEAVQNNDNHQSASSSSSAMCPSNEINGSLNQQEMVVEALKNKVAELTAELERARTAEKSTRLSSSKLDPVVDSFKDSLIKLRRQFTPEHPSQTLMDTMEANFSHVLHLAELADSSSNQKYDRNHDLFSTSDDTNTFVTQMMMMPPQSMTSSSTLSLGNHNKNTASTSQTTTYSSLTSSSANSPTLKSLEQQNDHAESSESLDDHPAVSNIRSNGPVSNTVASDLQQIAGESNVKKIISRLLSQNSMASSGTTTAAVPINFGNIGGHQASMVSSASFPKSTNRLSHITAAFENHNQNHNNQFLSAKSSAVVSERTGNGNNLLAISSGLSTNGSLSSTSSSSTSSATNSSSSLAASNGQQQQLQTSGAATTTKCIYYVGKCATPYMVTIGKPCEQVTLSDFKSSVRIVNSPATSYLYRFKTVDPEFGVIKEEVVSDGRCLPVFENKIVAWIESHELAR